jgi:dTDP-glucose pyrophosphorylase
VILITLAGESSRFFNVGFADVKYKLKLGNDSIIHSILEFIPRNEKLVIALNKKFNDYDFFSNLLNTMNFQQFKIVEISHTRGQLETVLKSLSDTNSFWNNLDSITIYNGDTIRKIKNWNFENCDGYIEVFESEGNHWSFVDNIGKVNVVTEKNRISSYCSSGLYFFKHVKFLLDFGQEYINELQDESYIAPFYNHLINKGFNVQSGLELKSNFIFCGTPEEYQNSLSNFNI